MKVLFQDATVEGPVRKNDLKKAVEKSKTAMCNKEVWREIAMKTGQREIVSLINSRRV